MLYTSGIGDPEILKLQVDPEDEAHYGVPEKGGGHCCGSMECHGIRKEVHPKAQQESNSDKSGAVLLNGEPEEKQDIDHRIDHIQDVQVVKNQDLGQDQAKEPDSPHDIIVSHS